MGEELHNVIENGQLPNGSNGSHQIKVTVGGKLRIAERFRG
jgi:hypothetical protein